MLSKACSVHSFAIFNHDLCPLFVIHLHTMKDLYYDVLEDQYIRRILPLSISTMIL